MVNIEKIVCPIDFSLSSFAALKTANDLAMQYSAELYLVHVVGPPHCGAMLSKSEYEWCRKRELSLTKMLLRKAIRERVPKYLTARSIIRRGDPADQIIQTASQKKADIIVMAPHGRTGLKRLVFGSVTAKVVCSAQCPVLIVHAPRTSHFMNEKSRMQPQHVQRN